ncbi:MAG: hypothetical protein KDA99_29020, partial [Planctomycetales bacterium]|nr:hypothetical protein [Planctomycetales bacterium]
MNTRQHTIRRVEIDRAERLFDEQLWPIHLSLAALGSFLFGIVVTVLRFDDPSWYGNAALWAVLVPMLTSLAMWLVARVENRLVRRTVLLSTILSLIINLAFIVIINYAKIFSHSWLEPTTHNPQPNHQRHIVLPEYVIRPPDPQHQVQRDLERPIESGEAAPTENAVSRQIPSSTLNDGQDSASQANVTQPTTQPKLEMRNEMSDAPPRRALELASLSRSYVRTTSAPSQLARAAPAADVQSAESVDSPNHPADASVDRSSPQLANSPDRGDSHPPAPETQRLVDSEISPARQQESNITRPEQTDQPNSRSEAPRSLPRQMQIARTMPRSQLPIQRLAPSVAQQTDSDAISPAPTSTIERRSTRPDVPETANTSTVSVAPQPQDPAATRMQQEDVVPEVASIRRPTRDDPRSRLMAPATSAVATDSTTTAPRTQAPSETLEASTSTISRNAVEQTVGRKSDQPLDESLATAPADVAPTSLSRNDFASQGPSPPSPQRVAVNSGSRRQQRMDAVGDFNTHAATANDSPGAPSAIATSAPAMEPSPMAVSKSLGGVAGIGSGPNLQQAVETTQAATGTANMASAATVRNEATQQAPRDNAATPSMMARATRAHAGSGLPGAPLKAMDIDQASAAGSSSPTEVSASSSASLTQAAANATNDAMTASKGESQLDLGPTALAKAAQQGRAEGGGQPFLNVQTQAQSLARRAVGGSPGTPSHAARPTTGDVADNDPPPPDEAGASANERETRVSHQAGGAPQLSGPRSADVDATGANSAELLEGPLQIARAAAIPNQVGPATAGAEMHRVDRRPSRAAFVPNTIAEEIRTGGTPVSAGAHDAQPIGTSDTSWEHADSSISSLSRESGSGSPSAGKAEIFAPSGPVVSTERAVERRSVADSPISKSKPMTEVRVTRSTSSVTRQPTSTMAIDPASFADADGSAPSPGDAPTGDADTIATASAEVGRQVTSAIVVDRGSVTGPGGLERQPVATDAGFLSRQARPDSQSFEPTRMRFLRRRTSGAGPQARSAVPIAADAFRRRQRREEANGGKNGAPTPNTDEAIERGLAFLSRHQLADGRWSLNRVSGLEGERASLSADTAATALSLLAYLGAGYDHKSEKYQTTVADALGFLVTNQQNDGNLYLFNDGEVANVVAFYSHAIAAIALCEAYGMTHDPDLEIPAQKALNFITSTQHPRLGGWRYTPGFESDTSVTGWMMMACKSGELAGLEVPPDCYDKINRWLDAAQASPNEPHLYRYNPLAPDTPSKRHGREPSSTMTSVGLLLRLYSGWRRDTQPMQDGADYLLQHLPQLGDSSAPQRDTYYWYYGTQVMFHMGGNYWKQWNDRLHPILVDNQVQEGPLAGSWHPTTPIPDRWGPHAGR